MKAGRILWSWLGIIAHLLISCFSYDSGGLVEDCAENELLFGCKGEGDVVVIKKAWLHHKYYRIPPKSCHIPEYNEQFRIESILHYTNKKCIWSNLCKFNLFKDVLGAKFKPNWKDGVIQVDYECVADYSMKTTCGTSIQEQEGWLRNVGYPNYYLGPGACTFIISVDQGQHIDINVYDLELKEIFRPMESSCSDMLSVSEGQKQLFSKCGTLNRAFNIISQGNYVNVTLHSGTEVFLNRGFVIHFKAIGCPTPVEPSGGYLSFRNEGKAEFKCNNDYLFADTLGRTRILICKKKLEWNQNLPSCVHIDDLLSSGNITQNEYLTYNGSVKESKIHEDELHHIIIPSVVLSLLFIGNFVVLIIIAFFRRINSHKFKELEEVKDDCIKEPIINTI